MPVIPALRRFTQEKRSSVSPWPAQREPKWMLWMYRQMDRSKDTEVSGANMVAISHDLSTWEAKAGRVITINLRQD